MWHPDIEIRTMEIAAIILNLPAHKI